MRGIATSAAGAILAIAAFGLSGSAWADQKTNILDVGTTDEAVTLDPADGTQGNAEIPVLYTIYDRLVDFAAGDMALRPGLATAWKWSDDKLTLELDLRHGVKFQDNTDLDADAVKFSLQHFKDVHRQRDLDPVTSIEVRDKYTLLLHVAAPYAALPAMLADRGGMIVSPTAVLKLGKDFARHPIGAGPFMLTDWVTGKIESLRRFDGYWDKGEPKLAGVDFHIIPNATSLVSALETGQLDFASGVDAVNLPVLKKNAKLQVHVEPSVGFGTISLNTSLDPIKDARVRRAINLSIDRQAIGRAVYGNQVEVTPATLPYPPGFWTANPTYDKAFTYNPAEAKKLLAEAGHPDGVKFEICAPAAGGLVPGKMVSDIMQQQMKPAGIDLQPTVLATSAACINLFQVKYTIPGILLGWGGRPDPFLTYSQQMATKSQYNAGQTDFGADPVLAKLNAATTREEQKPLYDQLDRIWVEQAPQVPLYYLVNVVAYGKNVTGERTNMLARPNVRYLHFQ